MTCKVGVLPAASASVAALAPPPPAPPPAATCRRCSWSQLAPTGAAMLTAAL